MRIATTEISIGTDSTEYAHLFTLPSTINKWYYNKSRLGRTYILFRLSFVRNIVNNESNVNNIRICEYMLSSLLQSSVVTECIQLRNLSGNDNFIVIAKVNEDKSIDVYARVNHQTTQNYISNTLLCDVIGGDMVECIQAHPYSRIVNIEDTTGYLKCYIYDTPIYADIVTQNDFTWVNGGKTNSKILVHPDRGTCEISAKITGVKRASTPTEALKIGVTNSNYIPKTSEQTFVVGVRTDKTTVILPAVIGATSGNIIVYGLLASLETEAAFDYFLMDVEYRYKEH